MNQSASSSHFPYLSIHLKIGAPDEPGFECDIEPLVDTGFDGGVVVPRGLIPESLEPIDYITWTLADGTEVLTPAYFCSVTIGQLEPVFTAVIPLADTTLLGRHVTDSFRVIFDHGQTVIVEP